MPIKVRVKLLETLNLEATFGDLEIIIDIARGVLTARSNGEVFPSFNIMKKIYSPWIPYPMYPCGSLRNIIPLKTPDLQSSYELSGFADYHRTKKLSS